MRKVKYLKETVGVIALAILTFGGGMMFLLSTESALAENQSHALLVSPIKVSLKDSVNIKAVAQWLACRHSCVPGNSSISLDLKVY